MMKHKSLLVSAVLAVSAGLLFAQKSADAPPANTLAFEVVSIKPVDMPTQAQILSGKIHAGMKIDAARVDIGLMTLMDLICKAYDVKQYQVQAPDWLKSQTPITGQHYDVIAKMPAGATKEQVPQMLQAMLADRFHLVIHKDKKEQSVYALIVDKGGPKLKESDPLPAPAAQPGGPTAASSGSSEVTFKQSGNGGVVSDGEMQQKVSVADGKIHYDISRITMARFVESGVAPLVDRPVVDLTELKGKYDIVMDIPMAEVMNVARRMGVAVPNQPGGADSGRPADAAEEPTGSIFSILKSQGLKLEARKVPIDLIVIDKLDKTPTDN